MGLETVWWYLSSSIIICRTSDFNWDCCNVLSGLVYNGLGVALARWWVYSSFSFGAIPSRGPEKFRQPTVRSRHAFKVWRTLINAWDLSILSDALVPLTTEPSPSLFRHHVGSCGVMLRYVLALFVTDLEESKWPGCPAAHY